MKKTQFFWTLKKGQKIEIDGKPYKVLEICKTNAIIEPRKPAIRYYLTKKLFMEVTEDGVEVYEIDPITGNINNLEINYINLYPRL